MRQLTLNTAIEFGPMVVFVVVYYLSSFFVAVAVTVAAVAVATLVAFFVESRVPWFPIISSASIVVFGIVSLLTKNEMVYMLQDTLANAGFALCLGLSVRYQKPILKTFFQHVFALSDEGWRILTKRWAIFYTVIAIGFEIVRNLGTTEQWVEYKACVIVATILFGCYQFRLSHRMRLTDESKWLGLRTKAPRQ